MANAVVRSPASVGFVVEVWFERRAGRIGEISHGACDLIFNRRPCHSAFSLTSNSVRVHGRPSRSAGTVAGQIGRRSSIRGRNAVISAAMSRDHAGHLAWARNSAPETSVALRKILLPPVELRLEFPCRSSPARGRPARFTSPSMLPVLMPVGGVPLPRAWTSRHLPAQPSDRSQFSGGKRRSAACGRCSKTRTSR